jgi:hypothetical protein
MMEITGVGLCTLLYLIVDLKKVALSADVVGEIALGRLREHPHE